MKHLKRFNEALDYSDVSPNSEYDKDDYIDYAKGYIHQVENATGKRVTDISGTVGESEIDIRITIEGGNAVDIEYEYAPYRGYSSISGRDMGYLTVTYTTPEGSISKRDDEETEDQLDAGEDVYGLLKIILRELNPTYVIQLPRETAETSGYRYDIDNESRGYMMIDVEFETEEQAEAWIDSLYDKIKKK